MRIGNDVMIENTIINTIKLANICKLSISKIPTYIYKEDDGLGCIYKIEPPNNIHFNMFEISKYLGGKLPIYFDNKKEKLRCAVCILIIKCLLKVYIDGEYTDDEYFKCAAKWLISHKKQMRKIVGQVDISNLADIILQPCKLYEDNFNR